MQGMAKAALLLKLADRDQMDALRDARRDLADGAPGGAAVFLMTEARRNILDQPDWSDAPGPFDAVLGLAAPGGDPAMLADHLAAVTVTLGDLVDRQNSGVIAGREHPIVAGEGRIARLFFVRKRAELSDAYFHDYWLNAHGRMATGMADPPAYRQWHADEERTRAAGAAAGLSVLDLNGAAQTFFQSEEEIRRRFANAADFKSSAVYADILTFIDVERSAVAFFDICADA